MSQPPPRPRSHMLLADTPNAVGWARCHTRDVLRRWQVPPDLIDTVLLLVSELATNAVRHSGARQPAVLTSTELAKVRTFGLDLQLLGHGVVVQVADRDPRPPVLQQPGEEDEGGRGIFLVKHMSQQWGYYHPPAGGKVVWAEARQDVQPKPPAQEAAVPLANRAGRPRPFKPMTDEQPPADDPLVIGRVLVGLRGL